MLKFSYLILIVALVPFVVSSTHHKPKSCIEVKEYLNPTENNYFELYDDKGNSYKTFCDFESEPPFVWTLIESLTLTNAQKTMYRKNFAANIPLGECNTTWGLFRLPERNMQAILSSYGSTHYRATCNFNAEVGIGLDNRRDYVRFAKCRHATALTSGHTSTCTSIVDYINVRGHACRQCRVPFTGGSSQHIHIDLTRASTFCTTQSHFAVPDRITNEDVFGNYLNPNPLFSCAANENSTTNWWIGGVYLE